MGHKEDKSRSKAIKWYRILAVFHFVLGVLMLVCAGLATDNSNGMNHGYTDYGTPYYLGGFFVGLTLVSGVSDDKLVVTLTDFALAVKPFTLYGCNLFQALRFHFKAEILTFPVLSTLFLFTSIWEFKMVISGILCAFVGYKGAAKELESGVKNRNVAKAIRMHYVLAIINFFGCFIGVILAAVSGCDASMNDVCNPRKADLRYSILAGCLLAVLSSIFTIYHARSYGGLFGLVMRTRGKRRVIMKIDTTCSATTNNTPTSGNPVAPVTTQATATANNNRNNERMEQLERENELLQRQLQLQKELNEHQQRGGLYPAPPPMNYGASTASAAPPPYSATNYDEKF